MRSIACFKVLSLRVGIMGVARVWYGGARVRCGGVV